MVGLQDKDASSEAKPSYLCITPNLVWSDIEESVKFKYQVYHSIFKLSGVGCKTSDGTD